MFPVTIAMSESYQNPGVALRDLYVELDRNCTSNAVLSAQLQAEFLARVKTEQGGDLIQPSALMTLWFKMGKLDEEIQLQRKALFYLLGILGDEKEHDNMVKRQQLEKKRDRQEKKLVEQQQKMIPPTPAPPPNSLVAASEAETQPME
jgi:hypothetical protein